MPGAANPPAAATEVQARQLSHGGQEGQEARLGVDPREVQTQAREPCAGRDAGQVGRLHTPREVDGGADAQEAQSREEP